MKVFVCANDKRRSLDAKEWVKERYKPLFTDLEHWALAMEAAWGECYIFIEIVLPQAKPPIRGSHNQIDMLICFSQLVVPCEVKSHSRRKDLDLSECSNQIQGQIKWLNALLREEGFEQECRRAFLFLPRLEMDHIAAVSDALVSLNAAHHIWSAGAQTIMKGRRDSGNKGRPYYLTEALTQALEDTLRERSSITLPGPCDLQEFFHRRLTQSPASLFEFDSFRTLRTFLAHISWTTQILFDPEHVQGLRQDELNRASRILAEKGVIEVIGPPGIGKTTFAKELIEHSGLEYQDLRLNKCRSLHDVCSKISERIGADLSEGLGDETFIQYLADQRYVFWIMGYDEVSAISLGELLRKIQTPRRTAGQVEARWIIESHRPLPGFENSRLTLRPLDNQSIYRILEKITPGGAFNNPEDVVRLARGNPDRARRLWEAQHMEDVVDAGNGLKWLRRQFSPLEARVLPILCLASQKCPFGLTLSLLIEWATTLYPDQLRGDIQEAIESLLEKLDRLRLLGIAKLDREIFEGLLDHAAAEIPSLTVVHNVDSELIAYGLSLLQGQEQNTFTTKFHEVLLKAAEKNTLAEVTFCLNLGDLEPFFRSSFRFTFLRRTLTWIENTEGEGFNPGQTYLLKAMRILTRIRTSRYIDVEGELGKPQGDVYIQRFAFDLVKAAATLSSQLDAAFDLSSWLRKIEQCADSEVQAALYVVTGMSLQHSSRNDRAGEAWDIFRNLWDNYDHNSTARCLAIHQTLAYLNRTKVWQGVVDDKEAHELVSRLSRELIVTGLKLQNIQLVCEALFHFVRSQEFRIGRTSYADVLGYRAALSFVEAAQGRTVMGMQVLLTQGSIYRHFCRQENIRWEEFRQAMEEGFECYSRAFKSAWAHDHKLHILNATAYMIDFCIKALRFVQHKGARRVIEEAVQKAIACAQKIEQKFAADIRGDEENIFLTIQRTYPLLLFISAVAESHLSGETKSFLVRRFTSYVDSLLGEIQTGRNPEQRRKVRQRVDEALKKILRTLNFGQQCDRRHYANLREELRPDLQRLLHDTRRLFVDREGKTSGPWKKLWDELQLPDLSTETEPPGEEANKEGGE